MTGRPLVIRSAVIGQRRVWRAWCRPCGREVLRMYRWPHAVYAARNHYRHNHEPEKNDAPESPKGACT